MRRMLLVGSGAAMLIGGLLPWEQVPAAIPGALMPALGAAVLLIGVARSETPAALKTAAVVGVAGVAVTLWAYAAAGGEGVGVVVSGVGSWAAVFSAASQNVQLTSAQRPIPDSNRPR